MPADTILLDIHAHLVPIEKDRLEAMPNVEWLEHEGRLVVDGHAIGLKKLFDPSELVRWMDEHRVANAWISIPPPAYRPRLGAPDAQEWATYVNRGLEDIAEKFPSRLSPLVHLTVEHPDLASSIAEAAIAGGRTRFAMSTGGEGIFLSDSGYRPLWKVLDDAGAFVFMHPGAACDARLDPYYLENLLGNPYETALAASHLVFGRVIEQFSRIRFCLAHAGGATPQIAGRLERGFETARPGIDVDTATPRTLLRRVCVDCIAHHPGGLDLAASVFGRENVLFGSDWPFPMGLPDPRTQLADCGPDLLEQIFDRNAHAILKQYAEG